MELEEAREIKARFVDGDPVPTAPPGFYEKPQLGLGMANFAGPEKQEIYYVSGPMTGNKGFNYAHFNEIAQCLRTYGHQVINPAENFGGDPNRDRTEYMRLDVQHVLDASDIVLLPGWEKSRGARLEATIALEIGLRMWYLIPHYTGDALVACDMQAAHRDTIERELLGTHSWETPQSKPTVDVPRYESILEEAAQITSKDRQQVYGHPREDFAKTVGMWNALFERKLVEPFDERDFCTAMICVKMSRLQKTPEHHDSLLDIVGYARCYEMVQESMDDEGR